MTKPTNESVAKVAGWKLKNCQVYPGQKLFKAWETPAEKIILRDDLPDFIHSTDDCTYPMES